MHVAKIFSGGGGSTLRPFDLFVRFCRFPALSAQWKDRGKRARGTLRRAQRLPLLLVRQPPCETLALDTLATPSAIGIMRGPRGGSGEAAVAAPALVALVLDATVLAAKGAMVNCSMATTASGAPTVVRALHSGCTGDAEDSRHRAARRWRRSEALPNSRMPPPTTAVRVATHASMDVPDLAGLDRW